jgi:hypothetical protein
LAAKDAHAQEAEDAFRKAAEALRLADALVGQYIDGLEEDASKLELAADMVVELESARHELNEARKAYNAGSEGKALKHATYFVSHMKNLVALLKKAGVDTESLSDVLKDLP